MKGYGHLEYGAPYSSSSSSLSPLAPPFTVDSSFPRPQSNQMEPNLHDPFLQDATQYAFVANPSHGNHNWNQKDSQALFVPHSISNSSSSASPISGLSPGTNAICHGFGVPNFGPQISRPYHPQYAPGSVQDSSTSLSANKHGDLLPPSSYLPTAPIGAFWNGKSSEEQWKGKDVNLGSTEGYGQWKRKDMNLAVPPTYASLVNQGISSVDGQPACEEPSNVWAGKSTESLAGEGYVGSQCTTLPPRKLSSAIEESSRDVSFDMSRTSVLNPTSLQEVPYYRAPSPDGTMEPWSQVNPSIASYGGYFTGFDSYKADSLLVYRAPASVDYLYGVASNNCSSATPLNRTVSASMTPIERPTCDRKEAFARYGSSSIEESNKGYGDKGNNYDGFEENRCASSLLRSIRMLQDYPLARADALKKAKCKGQDTDYDLPGTLAKPKTGVSESFECSSDALEQANPGVDSPCWKGALDSRYSLFGEAEAGNPSNPAKISEHCLPINSDKPLDFTSLEVHKLEKRFGEADSSSSSSPFPMQSELAPQSLQPSNDGCPDGEPCQTTKLQHAWDSKITDLGIGMNDSTHVGTDWVYHVTDHLSSRRGNVCVDTNLTEPLLGRSNNTDGCQISRENIQTTISSMHNLSELLASYCSMDENALKEEDHSLLQQVVQSLNTSMLRAGGVRLVPEAQPLQSKVAYCSGSTTKVHKATVTSKYRGVKDIESGSSIKNAFEGKKNSAMFNMEEIPSGGNSDSEQDEMTEGVKEVLEKNFHDEDLPEEEQGLLYKNLWLEAEAALFAMKFKARVARMKSKMEKKNHNLGKGKAIDVEEIPSSNVACEEKIQSPRIGLDLNKDIPVESGTKENEVQEDVESSVLTRFRILKSRINKEEISSNPSKEIEEKVIHPGYEFAEESRTPWPFIRNEDSEDKVGIVNVDYCTVGPYPEPENFEFGGPFMVADGFSNGESGSPSSEWEHVLKEATWPVAA